MFTQFIHFALTPFQVWFQNRRMKDKRQKMTWPCGDPVLAAYVLQAAAANGSFPGLPGLYHPAIGGFPAAGVGGFRPPLFPHGLPQAMPPLGSPPSPPQRPGLSPLPPSLPRPSLLSMLPTRSPPLTSPLQRPGETLSGKMPQSQESPESEDTKVWSIA